MSSSLRLKAKEPMFLYIQRVRYPDFYDIQMGLSQLKLFIMSFLASLRLLKTETPYMSPEEYDRDYKAHISR